MNVAAVVLLALGYRGAHCETASSIFSGKAQMMVRSPRGVDLGLSLQPHLGRCSQN